MGNTSAVTLVRVQGLTKVYASGRILVTALKDVSLELEKGVFAAITGISGSGKSTFLNLLGGLDTPTSGMIEVEGRKISEMNRTELAAYRRSGVGMIFQSFNLIPGFTALENVELPLMFAEVPKHERKQKAAQTLDKVGLAARLEHRPAELSGGEQQRVAIARALINDPQILLADEPTGNLDSRTSRDIVKLLSDLNRSRGLTVVMVSHEEALAREFAAKSIRLHDGQVVTQEQWR